MLGLGLESLLALLSLLLLSVLVSLLVLLLLLLLVVVVVVGSVIGLLGLGSLGLLNHTCVYKSVRVCIRAHVRLSVSVPVHACLYQRLRSASQVCFSGPVHVLSSQRVLYSISILCST